jgi:hypothetical protein
MICWFHSCGNSIRFNRELVFLINHYQGSGLYIREQNMRESLSLFVSRALFQPNGTKLWLIDQNRYLAPTTLDKE